MKSEFENRRVWQRAIDMPLTACRPGCLAGLLPVLALAFMLVPTSAFSQIGTTPKEATPIGYWDGAPTVSIQDLRSFVESEDALQRQQDEAYRKKLEACVASGSNPNGVSLSPASAKPPQGGTTSADLSKKSMEELRATAERGDMAAITEISRRTTEAQMQALAAGGASPSMVAAMGQYQGAIASASAPPSKAAGTAQLQAAVAAKGGGPMAAALGSAMAQSITVGRDAKAGACLGEQKQERTESLLPNYQLPRVVIALFEHARSPKGFAVVLYAGGEGFAPVNVVDRQGPWGSQVEPLDKGVRRAFDYDAGRQERPRAEQVRMSRPITPVR